jgi:Glycosyl transferases group 1
MRWIIYGDILSRHAVNSLISALSAAGQDVVEVPAVSRGHRYAPDPDTEAESRRRIEAQLPADVLFNFRPEELTPTVLGSVRERGVRTITWFADDPLLYKINSRHVVEAYDITLHTGREDVLAFYEDKHGVRGYSFPFWTDDAHYPYGYDPEAADIEVGFLGNCHKRRRGDRYGMLASLPWKARLFGRLADGATDEAGIQAGVLDRAEIPEAIRRFRLAINFSQRFDDVEKRYAFPGLKKFGEYFFPSRMVLYAAVGIPTVSLTLPGLDPPFGSVITATDRDEVVARIGEVIDDRQALTELSRRARADFEECLTAQSRAALMLSLLDGPHDHDRATRANLWRSPA